MVCCLSVNEGYHCNRPIAHEGAHESIEGWSWFEVKKPEKLFNGVKSTKVSRLELIPKATLEALADRFELGIERKGDGAWNSLTLEKSEVLDNTDFVIERLSHCIHHCYDAIQKLIALNNGALDNSLLNGEDDAGAILFGGSVLAEFKARRKPKE